MIRRIFKFRPALTYGFVLLWTFHFSFGMLYHYHPEYVHAHGGELQAHAHGGHFHSPGLEHLAQFIEPAHDPLPPGEAHHHSESLPGSDAETVQYDLNKSSLPAVQLVPDFNPSAAPIFFDPAESKPLQPLLISSDASRILLYPQSHSERSPPLRL